jgi:hypothetical protein
MLKCPCVADYTWLVTVLGLLCALPIQGSPAPDHAEPGRLTGTYSIGAAQLVDPAPGDRRDALLRLYLTGNAARDLFNTIAAKPTRDVCFDDGTVTKMAGEIMCAKHPRGVGLALTCRRRR